MFWVQLLTSQQQLNAEKLCLEWRVCLVHGIKHRPSSKMLTEVYIYSTENPGCVLRQCLGGYSPHSTSQLEHQEQVIPLLQAECPCHQESL